MGITVVIEELDGNDVVITENTTTVSINESYPTIILNELGDVSVTSPTNGQIIQYVSATNTWENSSAGVGDMLKSVYDTNNNGKVDTSDALIAHEADTTNPHSVTKAQVGLADVPNLDTTDAVANEHTHVNKALLDTYDQTNTDLTSAVSLKHSHSNKTILDNTTASFTSAEETKLSGIETGAEVNVQSDWNESDTADDSYIKNKPSLATGDMTKAVYDTNDNGKVDTSDALITHEADVANPHSVTKTQVGLSNVPNTDFTSAVSANTTHRTSDGTDHSHVVLNDTHRGQTDNPHSVTKTQIGLSNVPNTDCTNANNITTGTIASSVLPPVALTTVQVAVSEAAQLALTAEEGDVCVRTDENKSYMHNAGSAGSMSDWTELQTPTDTVLSVNGETGTVILTTGDISEDTNYRYMTDAQEANLDNQSGTNTGDVSVTDSSEIDFTLTSQNITAVLKAGSIDESKLDTSVNTSLDKADSALQSFTESDPVFTASQAHNIDSTDITNLGNLSGINTGDQDLSGLALKSNVLELDNTTIFTPDADYEPATKKYVDDNGGGSTYTFTNGLNEASNTVKLGGIVSENTDIELEEDIEFTITSYENTENIVSQLFVDNYEIKLLRTDFDDDIGLVIDEEGALFYDDVNEKGLEYASDYSTNFTDNSLVSKKYVDDNGGGTDYANTIIVAKTGGDYDTIQAAINASTSADKILIYPGTYTENVTTKAGAMTTLVGEGTMGSVVIEANTGTVLTVPSAMMSMAFIKNLKLKSTATGANASKLVYAEGTMTSFNSVSFDYNISNGYTEEIIDLEAGSFIFTGCKFDFDSTGTIGGNISFINSSGAAGYQIMQGFGTMSFASTSADHLHFFKDSSSGHIVIRDFNCDIEATSASYAGHLDFIHSTNSNNIDSINNKVSITTPSGAVGSYGQVYHLAGASGGHIHSTANKITIEGFEGNYIGNINATEQLISHFDDIVAEEGILGTGTYSYVNSPTDGDLQMSGNIIKKLINITTDYDETESWVFGILSANSSTADITATLNPTYFAGIPSGATKTFINAGSTYNLILNPNGATWGGSTQERVIYPGGYMILERVGNEGIIISSKNTSFNIDITSIDNPSFHVDFSDASSVTVDGSNHITNVVDSVNSWNGTPSSATGVEYGITTQNGLNTAKWDTNNTPLSFGNNDINDNTAGRGMTIIAVVKAKNTGDAIMSKYYDATPQREWRFYSSNITIYNNLDASGQEAVVNYSSNYGEWQVLQIEWVPGSKAKAYKNGYLLGTSSYNVTAIPSGTANLLMGASDLTGADFIGEIGEILAFSDTITDDERAAVTSKLGAKWDINVAVYSAADASPFGRNDDTNTIKPLIDNDNLDIGTGTITSGNINGIDVATDVAANTAKVSYPGSADATELNILDGATLTTTELNYVEGVTSSIQTQINAKGTGTMSNVVEDTTPQLGGNLDLNNKSITTEETAGESLVSGNLCYLKSDGKYWKADASADTTCKTELLMCIDTISADATGTFIKLGEFTTTGLTASSLYYVSETAGAITATAPTTSTSIQRIIGTALSTTVLKFNPSSTYIEV